MAKADRVLGRGLWIDYFIGLFIRRVFFVSRSLEGKATYAFWSARPRAEARLTFYEKSMIDLF
jgi:hypothetical protein